MQLGILLVTIGLCNVADFVLTLRAVPLGARELNPLMSAILDTPWFPLYKLGVVPVLLLALWLVRERMGRRLMPYVYLVSVAYLGLMAYHGVLVWGGPNGG